MSKPIRRDYDSNGKLKPYSRCRKWELQVSITESGKSRKRSRRYNGHTYREACDELARFRVDVENETPKSGWMFSKYAERWIASRRDTLSKSTISNNTYAVNLACETFGCKCLEDIGKEDMESFKTALRASYGKAAQHTHWCTVSSIFNSAIRERLLALNPCSLVESPKKARSQRKVPDMDKLNEIVAKLNPRNGGFELAITMLACTGLRRGELCGLLWSDFKDGGLSVTKQEGGKPTKTGKSRFVPLPSHICSMLEEMRGDDSDQIIMRKGGLAISGSSLGTWWINNREKYGAAGVRLHDFRHAYVTAMAESGAPVAVTQSLVGHTTPTMTLEVYTHVHSEAAMKAVQDVFGASFAANLRQ